jgi:serine/threonine protein phosphatase PrpC
MKTYAATHVGRVRTINEDSYYLPRPGETFAIVADGMGGHLAGEVASAMAVDEFSRSLRAAEKPGETAIERAVSTANRLIYETAQADPSKRGMGTTLTAVWFGAGEAFLTHIGDSRAYLLRNRALMQLSCDHSLVNELVRKGEITPEEALVHPQRNFITRALGTGRHVTADILRLEHRPDDVWMLCTDGLTNYLRAPEMTEVLLRDIPWQQKIDHMFERALDMGGSDNITCVLVTGEEAGA